MKRGKTASKRKLRPIYGLALFVMLAALAWCQETNHPAVLAGSVHDRAGKALPSAIVTVRNAGASQTAVTDAKGEFRFASIPSGSVALRVELPGYSSKTLDLTSKETHNIALTLDRDENPASRATSPDFYDEPQFTVAGVAPPDNSGAHGSDTVLRTTDAMARATAALDKHPDAAPITSAEEQKLHEDAARAPDDASVHHALAVVEERLGKPLDAVREYQRAAELDPSEPNLFDWGTDLLAHRALQPAEEVFSKGRRLHRKSARMAIGLGVSDYALGDDDKATLLFLQAAELNPNDATPFLFVGKIVAANATPPAGSVEGLARFASAHPEIAKANYYYALALWKQNAAAASRDATLGGQIESLLRTALRLDPKLGPAYLQLGIVRAQAKDFPGAISAYQKAIEASSPGDELLAEAHYRLAQAYLKIGEKSKAQVELELHSAEIKKLKNETDQAKVDIQEFVITLRGTISVPPPRP